jgi:hypothetical protein
MRWREPSIVTAIVGFVRAVLACTLVELAK